MNPIHRRLDALIYPDDTGPGDFLEPAGEAALTAPDSLSWQVFRNPFIVFIGGVTAVLLELAEPRVRTGVWEHTRFRTDPLGRLRRTGYATMMTVYGARSRTETMIDRINRGHERIAGTTPGGLPYRAADDDLLTWVHVTASFGFLRAYETWARPLTAIERDRFYGEGQASARLYGVGSPPGSEREVTRLFAAMEPRLEPSDIVFEFLQIVQGMSLLPAPARALQRLLVKAAVHGVPDTLRTRLGLDRAGFEISRWEAWLLRVVVRGADVLRIATLPCDLARRRIGPDRSHGRTA